MKSNRRLATLTFTLTMSALILSAPVARAQSGNLASYVNPMVGTDRGGDTFPVAPFGSVQMNPNWSGIGYRYRNTAMHGFAVNSMSGPGGTDEGQILITATTGDVKVDRASTDFQFDHQHESASAGYYEVMMQPWNIKAEMTANQLS